MSYPPPPYPQQPPYVPGQPPQQYTPAPPQYGVPYPPPAPYPPQAPPPKRPPNAKLPWIVGGSVLVFVVLLCLVGAVVSDGDSRGGSGDKVAVKAPTQAGKSAATTKAKATEDADQPKTFDVSLGSAITADSGDGTVEGVARSVKTYKAACNDLFPDPKNGVFVVVDVVVRQKKGTGSVNPLDFTFVDEDGTTANALSAAFSGCDEPSLDSTNSLRAGQKRAGKIAFDATSSRGTVEWAPGGLWGDAVGSWKIG